MSECGLPSASRGHRSQTQRRCQLLRIAARPAEFMEARRRAAAAQRPQGAGAAQARCPCTRRLYKFGQHSMHQKPDIAMQKWLKARL